LILQLGDWEKDQLAIKTELHVADGRGMVAKVFHKMRGIFDWLMYC
jgi:hypothetical protein